MSIDRVTAATAAGISASQGGDTPLRLVLGGDWDTTPRTALSFYCVRRPLFRRTLRQQQRE